MPDVVLVLDCADADALAAFWTAALGYRTRGSAAQYRSIEPPPGAAGPKLVLQQVDEPKSGKNRLHLDIELPGSEVDGEVARLESLGARRLDDAPVEEHGVRWWVMADPEGNECCVCGC
jgi:hypothetical protein